MHLEKTDKNFNEAKIQQSHEEKEKMLKMKIGAIKLDTPEAQPRVIP